MSGRPSQLRINAWTGRTHPSIAVPAATGWTMPGQVMARLPAADMRLGPEMLVDPRDWRSPRVGWGLILPDDPTLDPAVKARGDDAPEPLRELLRARGDAPVLRWSPTLRQGHLQRYYEDGGGHSLKIATPRFGVGHGLVPRYLLIAADPARIPWSVQYDLNTACYVGRLALEGEALEQYVSALLADWLDEPARRSRAMVWSTDTHPEDITYTMARVVGRALVDKLKADGDVATTWTTGRAATAAALAAGLADHPGLICTTSHGMTGPLDDADALRATLGSPVDQRNAVVTTDALGTQASGAIWYSQACCAAGSDVRSRYAGLFTDDDEIGTTLRSVAAAAGACVAPLPQALLGAAHPLRAFVGHVEPSFNWALQDPIDNEVVGHGIAGCLYDRLFQTDRPSPIGWALETIFAESQRFYSEYVAAKLDVEPPADPQDPLYRQLAAVDRQSIVILGDPTVSLPA